MVKGQINQAHLNKSNYKDAFDKMTDGLSVGEIIDVAKKQCLRLETITSNEKAKETVETILLALEILEEGPFDTMNRVLEITAPNKESKELVEGAPKPVKENVAKAEAEEMKAKFEAAGAVVELK